MLTDVEKAILRLTTLKDLFDDLSVNSNVVSVLLDREDERALKTAIEALREQRPHGEWIPYKWDDNYSTKIPLPKGSDSESEEYWAEEFICSVCGKAHHKRSFCPYCGADMRKEGDEK